MFHRWLSIWLSIWLVIRKPRSRRLRGYTRRRSWKWNQIVVISRLRTWYLDTQIAYPRRYFSLGVDGYLENSEFVRVSRSNLFRPSCFMFLLFPIHCKLRFLHLVYLVVSFHGKKHQHHQLSGNMMSLQNQGGVTRLNLFHVRSLSR